MKMYMYQHMFFKYTSPTLPFSSFFFFQIISWTGSDKRQTLEHQPWNSIQWSIYVFNSVDDTKLPCYTLPPTEHHSFFRNLYPLFIFLEHIDNFFLEFSCSSPAEDKSVCYSAAFSWLKDILVKITNKLFYKKFSLTQYKSEINIWQTLTSTSC